MTAPSKLRRAGANKKTTILESITAESVVPDSTTAESTTAKVSVADGSRGTASGPAPAKKSPMPLLRRKHRIGGVAPFVRPLGRFAQRRAARTWGRRGFVPLTPGRTKKRHRILPRTVIGISSMLMAFGIGAAFAGAGFYAYYDNRLAENERQIARFVDGFDEQFVDASTALDDQRVDAVEQIRDELVPLGEYTTDAAGVIGLPATAGPSVWAVATQDENGVPIGGSAFAVAGHNGGTALVTSLSVVRASTAAPGPMIELVKGDQRIVARLWAWDDANNLGLLLTDAEIPLLDFASPTAQASMVGGRVFALSGIGGQGATASPGVLVDRSVSGLQHTAVLGTFFEGGPLLDGSGRIVGVATAGFHPLGIDPGSVLMAPDVGAMCLRLLRCAESASDTVTVEVGNEGNEGNEGDG
jgi:hypothetical protein